MDAPTTRVTPWWRERELILLLVLAAVVHAGRLTELPLRGEESRRAQVAVEMMARGDWIVPRQQGEPFLSRPPLGSYPIAVAMKVLGEDSPLAVRLPTVLATLVTVLLIYGYSRLFLSRAGALGAGLAYATFGQVLQLGRLAETEATFTVLVAGALMLWHWGYTRGWSRALTWSIAYTLAALGAMAKGPQAPAYFGGTVGLYLLLRRDWRMLFGPSHFAGIATFAAVLGAWQIPFAMQMGMKGVWAIWASDVGLRYNEVTWVTYVVHAITYPPEVLGGLLPWSALLLAYLSPRFRRAIGPVAGPAAIFWGVCLLVTFPTCWFVPNARARYYMPIYPGLAILVGVVIDRAVSLEAPENVRRIWSRFLRVMAVIAVLLGVGAVAVSVVKVPALARVRQTLPMAAGFAIAATGLAVVMRRARSQAGPVAGERGALAVAGLVGLAFLGPVLSLQSRSSEDAPAAIARLKASLPKDVKLVSFGPVHHLFAYYYGDPIAYQPLPDAGGNLGPKDEYFCFGGCDVPYRPQPFPFAWEPVAMVSCERKNSDKPRFFVVVGKKIPAEPSAELARCSLDRIEAMRSGKEPRILR